MKKFRITEIVDWYEDSSLMDGDASHEGYSAVEEVLRDEHDKKDSFEENYPGIIPFECVANDIDEAIEKLNSKYFDYDYLKVEDVDYDVLI